MNEPNHIDIAALHRRVCVADGHADSLMWNRDLNRASESGHVDFPRLREAGVKLQCFTIVTRGLPIIDGFELFAIKQGWPKHARKGEWNRCVWQLDRLAAFCLESNGTASIAAATKNQLSDNLANDRISAVVGIEGGHALEGKTGRVKELHERGVRFMSLSHPLEQRARRHVDAALGNKPLTQHGRDVLDAMGEVGMILDVSHASPSMLPSCFHTRRRDRSAVTPACRGATKLWRNLSDGTCKAIADRGGVVGIIFAPQFIGRPHDGTPRASHRTRDHGHGRRRRRVRQRLRWNDPVAEGHA